eukprot:3803467-Amphidinium_carterae.1
MALNYFISHTLKHRQRRIARGAIGSEVSLCVISLQLLGACARTKDHLDSRSQTPAPVEDS